MAEGVAQPPPLRMAHASGAVVARRVGCPALQLRQKKPLMPRSDGLSPSEHILIGLPTTCRTGVRHAGRTPGPPCIVRESEEIGDGATHNRGAAHTDGELQVLLHGDGLVQVNSHLGVVTRHHHVGALRQLNDASHIRGAEVELG